MFRWHTSCNAAACGRLCPSTTTTMEAAGVNPAVLASKRVVFCGGLPDEATTVMVRAAMIPFGDIKSVDMPMDYAKGVHRGFAFVEFEEPEDADECIFNMDGAELAGRTIAVSVAQANQMHKLSASSNEAVWKSDDWFQTHNGLSKEELAKQRDKAVDAKTLQEE